MATVLSAVEFLQRDYLEIRARILDIGAAMDRLDRACESDEARRDGRVAKLRSALELLCDGQADKAKRIQMVFSDEYDPSWRGMRGKDM